MEAVRVSAAPSLLLRHVVSTRMSEQRRDALLAEMVEVLYERGIELDIRACVHVLREAHAVYVPQTRRALHRYLCASREEGADMRALWRALLRAHLQAGDWVLVEEALRTSVARGAATERDVYEYTLRRMRHAPVHADPQMHAGELLRDMRASGAKLDDVTLAHLLHTLAIPVRRAHKAHAPPHEMADLVRPVRRVLNASFRWLRGDEQGVPVHMSQYRRALADMLELELFLAYAEYMSAKRHMRQAAWDVSDAAMPRIAVAPIRAKLRIARQACGEDDMRLRRVSLVLQASSGRWAHACQELRAWMERDSSARAAYEQRRVLVMLFSFACKHDRAVRLGHMHALLDMGASPTLWRHGDSYAPATTLVRLWLRFMAAWTHSVGVRCGHAKRVQAARSRHGWALMARALRTLALTAEQVPTSWSTVLDHPERCRALVRAARLAHAPDTPIEACLLAMRAPLRIWRWVRRAAAVHRGGDAHALARRGAMAVDAAPQSLVS